MKNQKMYEADDKMISIIRDNYNILQSLGSFGINLGFGDKTVCEVCEEQQVDTYTFLSVVNLTINGYKEYDDADRLSLPTLLHYLKASHAYYIDFQLPFIRKELVEALDEKDNLAQQMELVRREAADGAGAVILEPVDELECRQYLEENTYGTPIILLGELSPDEEVKGAVHMDWTAAGRKLGEAITAEQSPDLPVWIFADNPYIGKPNAISVRM